MDVALWVAAITAAVSIAGWVINHVLTSQRDIRNQQRKAYLSYTERQLEELYGPLAILVVDGRRSFLELLATLGRSHVFHEDGRLSPDELRTWLFWTEHEFLPRNEKIKSLLTSHAHLIEGHVLPDSYVRYLDHHNSWAINHLRWQEEGIEYSWHSRVNYPKEFEDEVLHTLHTLKSRHADLVAAIGQSG